MGKTKRDLRARALEILAESLDVEETLARVPGLTREKLRAFLLEGLPDKPASRTGARVKRVTPDNHTFYIAVEFQSTPA